MKTKINRIIEIIIKSILCMTFLFSLGMGTFFYCTYSKIEAREIESIAYPKFTKIYDSKNHLVEEVSSSKLNNVVYSDLPKLLVEALLSIEDNEFFYHSGINEKRIMYSFFNNLVNKDAIQGGSTITQQLVKNTMLSNDKTYERKIKEMFLSFELERKLTKEEILELYFNHVYFDQSFPGVYYASRRFFNKTVQELSLPEIALLVGLVKSPSYYHPIIHPDRAEARKNLVLLAMLKQNVINQKQFDMASNTKTSSLIHSPQENDSYQYQAYLDVVYQEVKELLNIDVYQVPLKVETYLDTSLQTYLDDIQEGKIISIDSNQQIGSAVIKNEDVSIIGVIGGNSYKGKKLYNHASDLEANPASTMKPIFTYALGVEKYQLHQMSTLEDIETTYPNSSIQVHNADNKYLGKITLIDALGYSRNTTTISLLSRLENDYGRDYLINYLKTINLFDNGNFSLSYGIGGFTYGTNPINLAGAYAMLANNGTYLKPSTIKRITSLDSDEILYERPIDTKQVLSYETTSIINDSLVRVIDNNYFGIKEAKPENISIAGKTGTNAYDSSTIKKYNFPSNADKDLWFAGYTPKYTITVWSGFDDLKTNKPYFYSGDARRKIPKKIFKKIMSYISLDKESFSISPSLNKVYVIKYLDDNYMPNYDIPSKFIDYTFLPKDSSLKVLPPLEFIPISNVQLIKLDFSLLLSIDENIFNDTIYPLFYGERGYLITLYYQDDFETFFSSSPTISIETKEKIPYKIEIKESFKDNNNIYGPSFFIEVNSSLF